MAGTDIRAKISLDSSQFTSGINSAMSAVNKLTGALGIGIGVGAFTSLVTGAMKGGEEIENLARRLQLTTNEAQQFQQVAQKVGVDVNALAKSFKDLKLAQQDAKGTPGGKEAAAFERLGITIEEVRNLQPMELLKLVADGFNANSGSAQTMADVLEVLGSKADALLPALAKLREELDKTKGRFLSPAEVKELAAADDVIDDAKIKGELWRSRFIAAAIKEAKEGGFSGAFKRALIPLSFFDTIPSIAARAELARRASEKPDPTKPVTVDPAEMLALQKQLDILDAKNAKLLQARAFIGATTDKEIELLQTQIEQLTTKRLGLDSDAERLTITGEILTIENRILVLKKRQADEAQRAADEQQRARTNIDRIDYDREREKARQFFADEDERDARRDARPDARTFTIGGGVSLGATDSMRAGIRGFDARLGGVNPRDLLGPLGGVQGKPLDGMGQRTLTVQESIAKTAHDQLVALRQIATNVLKIGGATAQ